MEWTKSSLNTTHESFINNHLKKKNQQKDAFPLRWKVSFEVWASFHISFITPTHTFNDLHIVTTSLK